MALGSITGRVIIFLKERLIIKFRFVGTLYPYLIPSEEGDRGALITGSAMGDLN